MLVGFDMIFFVIIKDDLRSIKKLHSTTLYENYYNTFFIIFTVETTFMSYII